MRIDKINIKKLHKGILLLVLAAFIIPVNAVQDTSKDSLIILSATDIEEMNKNVQYIENNGGKIYHKFPPNVLIGEIPANSNLEGKLNIEKITKGKLDTKEVKKYGKNAEIAVDAWNKRIDKLPNKPGKGKMKDLQNDSFKSPDITSPIEVQPNITEVPPYGAGFYDTSEYMIGDIGVGLVFLESNGVIDPSSEDWTSSEESDVVAEIMTGLDYWRTYETRASLTFTYNIYYGVPTRYEPITRSISDQGLWIQDAMTYLGFTTYSDYFKNVRKFDGYLRDSSLTDWAYTIFMVDSSNDADGSFSNGYSAYAYLGGPFTVLTYDNDGYGITNMDYVIAHETGHIFWATDEYNGVTEYSGYLNANDIEGSGYIMHCGVCWGVSSGTILQLGWRDTDFDNVFDIIDLYPKSSLYAYSPDPTNISMPIYKGSASAKDRYPNSNPLEPVSSRHNITVNKINSVRYRIDYGPWINANPVDGIFNWTIENYNFTTNRLSNGVHMFEVSSINRPAFNTEYLNLPNDTLEINRHTGGADYYGYKYKDNMAGGSSYGWTEIKSSGTKILDNIDDAYITIPLGFDFKFYGNTYSSADISSNGIIYFGPGSITWSNYEIGNTYVHNFIAPYWDDLTTYDGGGIYYKTYGTAPNRYTIIEYYNTKHCCTSYSTGVTFEVILYETSNKIVIRYKDVNFDWPYSPSIDFGNSSTVGIEGPIGKGLEYSFNEQMIFPGSVITIEYPSVPLASPVPPISYGPPLEEEDKI